MLCVQFWLMIESIGAKCLLRKSSAQSRVVKVLEPLSYFTDALSGEYHATVSAVRPLLSHILIPFCFLILKIVLLCRR